MRRVHMLGAATALAFAATTLAATYVGFAPQQSYPAGDGPHQVRVADFDGDGVLDLATSNEVGDDMCVLFGNGDTTFGAPVFYPAENTPLSIGAADIDSDGDVDLTVCNANATSISIYFNNGDGTFTTDLYDFDPNLPPYPGVLPVHTMADFDGDGDTDIAVMSLTGTSIMILPNDGNGNFGPHQVIAEPGGPGFPIDLEPGDFDGDGDIDLVWVTGDFLGHGPGHVLLNNDDAPWTDLPFDTEGAGIVSPPADFNHDGILDLALIKTINPGGYMLVTLGNGDGTFGPQTSYDVNRPYPPTTADINGDGDIDLIVPSFGPYHTISVMVGNGDGTFENPVPFAAGGNNPQDLVAVDINGDSRPDIVSANRGGDNVSIFINLGCPGDVDGDSDVDLTDLAILLSDFDCTGGGCVGDGDGDGDTDLEDLALLLSGFDNDCN